MIEHLPLLLNVFGDYAPSKCLDLQVPPVPEGFQKIGPVPQGHDHHRLSELGLPIREVGPDVILQVVACVARMPTALLIMSELGFLSYDC